MMLTPEEIKNRFGHSAAAIEGPNPNEETHALIRSLFTSVAATLDDLLPDGRGKAVTFTELETASMWAHKTLANRT